MTPRVRLTADLLEQTARVMTTDEKHFDLDDLHPGFLRWLALQMMAQCDGMFAHFHPFESCADTCTDTEWDWLSRKPLWLAITSRVPVPHPAEVLLAQCLDEYRPDREHRQSDALRGWDHDLDGTDSDGVDGDATDIAEEPPAQTPPPEDPFCDEPPF